MTATDFMSRYEQEEEALSLADRTRRLERMARFARMMDTAVRIPGTNIRFGADAVISLVPGLGDGAAALMGLVIVNEARKLGLPYHKMARMIGNLGIDAVFGAVPIAGTFFDVYFKAHLRNIDIILDHFEYDEHDLKTDMKDVTPRL
ncbi:DUF4112 domain-containing protein [Aureimonas mangrovi]|uniref:DUF4112 domain-containing protein n=1 Tax=Aureimonas mangrovi TaxID=2758041 RepID=UPI00163DB0A6|nr:DUF4112 domain-containing protein [Aureimonas mangrovi]